MHNSWKVRLARWLMSSQHEKHGEQLVSVADSPHRSRILDNNRNAVHFTIHHASGGYVVETTFYDERKDHHNRSLHIITSQEDFSAELGKTVFMEMLKNR